MEQPFFESNDELYNMAIGEDIVSAYHGPADLHSFDLLDHSLSPSSVNKDEEGLNELESYYKTIRDFREGKTPLFLEQKFFRKYRKNTQQIGYCPWKFMNWP